MGNPYPADFLEPDGSVRLGGAINFTDQSNQPGGGSQPGVAITRRITFAFDTAALTAGVPVFVPTVGDLLLNAWFEIYTSWDGTTPSADISQFTGAVAPYGLWGAGGQPPRLDSAPDTTGSGGGPENAIFSTGTGNVPLALWTVPSVVINADISTLGHFQTSLSELDRFAPCRFSTVDPLLLVVTQDGSRGGVDPGSTVGAGALVIVTSSPVVTAA